MATCIIQARLGSTRLPGKVLQALQNDLSSIDIIIKRLYRSKKVNRIIVATTTNKEDDKLCTHVTSLHRNVQVVRGPQEDVLGRFCIAASDLDENTPIIRITADCPLVDPALLDEMLAVFIEKNLDYLSNTISPTFPDGFDIEIFKYSKLKEADANTVKQYDREHVTPYMKKGRRISNFTNKLGDYSRFRATIDEPKDLAFFKSISEKFDLVCLEYQEFCKFIQQNATNYSNQKIVRNEGAILSNNQKRFKHADEIILGGTSLFSKNPNLHHPKNWPSHFKSASGYKIEDVDGNIWKDISFMGIGTNVLGYADPDVDVAVINAIKTSNMSTLNSYEEIQLAEKLLEILDVDGLVKFTRSGGEANLLALRIARSATGKSGVAFCGYHGWHDWYLSANLGNDDKLQKHLLQGLATTGVPSFMQDKVFAFSYNSKSEFDKAVSNENVGTVIMEPMRNAHPVDGFIEHIRKTCSEKNIVLIFDECSSGFRETYGGYSKKLLIEPDVHVFGKTIANGYALNAVVGKREIMEAAKTSFISSTFWSEKIGFVAALATLQKMKEVRSYSQVSKRGLLVKKKWRSIFRDLGLDWVIQGTNGIPNFTIPSEDAQVIKTFITQNMLEKGWLSSTALYVSVVHTNELLNLYFEDFYDTLNTLTSNIKEGNNVIDLIDGPIAISGFQRLN